MTNEQWLCTPKARKAHLYDRMDPRFPMVAVCGHKEEPQRLFGASTIDQHPERPYGLDDPEYCPVCMHKEA